MSAELAVQPLQVLSHAQDNAPSRGSSRSPMAGLATATSGDSTTASSGTRVSASELQETRSSSMSPSSSSSSSMNPNGSLPNVKPEARAGVASSGGPTATTSATLDPEPDEQILEALRSSKDRIYVLKLGEQMEALIKDRRARIDLTPATSYQRLLVHRCSAYYKLSPETDPITKNIIVYYRSDSRIPPRRICELVPAEESAQPTIQIMRRPRGRQHSQPGSTAGEDADTSDVDASEAGSIGSRNNAGASAAAKRYKTIEEREAAYNEARSRIFMDFEEKEKEKEKDMSASSSTFSLVSGSGSTSGGRGSSIGDLDDSASSAPTESEWSGPVTRDKKDGRRGGGSTTSSRSLRSSGPSYTSGSGSSRNSRATSPSFTYPTLYDPASAPPYDQTQFASHLPPPAGYVAQYGFPPYNPPPGQPYMGQYYYSPYSYPPPPPQNSEHMAHGGAEPMYPPSNPPQQPAYNAPYMWSASPPSGQPPVPPHHIQPQHSQPAVGPPHRDAHPPVHPMPPMQNIPQYPPYAPGPPMYTYGMPGYFPQSYPPGTPMGPPPPMTGHAFPPGPMPEPLTPNVGHPPGHDAQNLNRTSSRNSNGHGSANGKRGGPRSRGSWTYGPGIGGGGPFGTPSMTNGMSVNDAYGPRLSTNMRRTSAASSSSGSAGARTPADETSSTTSSSTTSSSSRRTFTSTSTSSKHPLPARPDWAVGLKPQHPRHHDARGNVNSRTMSPARMGQPHTPQPVLQPNDFPPLSSGPSTRQPVVGGAWTNASTSRVMMPGPSPQGANPQGSALVHYPNSNSQQNSPQIPASTGRLEEQDPAAFERPPPKHAELFNPRGGGAAGGSDPRAVADKLENYRAKANGEDAVAGLVEKFGAVELDEAGSALSGMAREGACHAPFVMAAPTVAGDAATGTGVVESTTTAPS
ncbi:hypothetical protein BD414DRAFT_455322 [Trametes punicea]|nr:hypothetical protein BD414DRAFT_455322 [Trametes punicea]